MGPAARRRRGRDDVPAAVGPLHGLPQLGFVGLQVPGAEDAAEPVHLGGDGLRDGPLVERPCAAGRDPLQRRRQVFVLEDAARFERQAVREIDRRRGRELADLLDLVDDHAVELGADGDALAGQADGRGEDLGQAHRPVFFQGQGGPGDESRHTDGVRPLRGPGGEIDARGVIALGRRPGRGRLAVVDHDRRFASHAHDHEAAAAHAGRVGLGHAEGEGDRDRGVDGVAALLEDLDPDGRGGRVGRGDHRLARGDVARADGSSPGA